MRSVEVSAIAKSVPLVSLSGSAPVGGLGGCILICLVEERVDTRVGRTKVSSFIGGAGRAHGPVLILLGRDRPVPSGASPASGRSPGGGTPVLARQGRVLGAHLRGRWATVFRLQQVGGFATRCMSHGTRHIKKGIEMLRGRRIATDVKEMPSISHTKRI